MSPDEYRLEVAKAMTEAVLQARIVALARTLGWWAYWPPVNRPGARTGRVQHVMPGWPDLVLVHRERGILYRENKTHAGPIRPEQRETHELLRAAGADVAVWRPLDLLEGRIEDELTRGQRR